MIAGHDRSRILTSISGMSKPDSIDNSHGHLVVPASCLGTSMVSIYRVNSLFLWYKTSPCAQAAVQLFKKGPGHLE
jgi:hypothetical protein